MGDADTIHRRTREFLADHPEATPAVRTLVDLDEGGPWTFEDVPLDSGRFGTLVSLGIAEHAGDDGYRLSDRDAVRSALAGEPVSPGDVDAAGVQLRSLGRSVAVDWSKALGLAGALALIVAVRAIAYEDVLRAGEVVSPGNDPYFFRWHQRRLLELTGSPIDVFTVADAVPARPLAHVANWWLSALLGGSPWAADQIAAWLPPLASAALGVVVYLTAVALTDDARVGVAAAATLAVIPIHAVYTSLGFLDHNAHQYLWLGVVVLGFVWLAVAYDRHHASPGGSPSGGARLRDRWTWFAIGVAAIGIAASVHAWRGSLLNLAPIALYLGVRAIGDVRYGRSPLRAIRPEIVAIGVGVALGYVPYLLWDWHAKDSLLVHAPLLILLGVLGAAAVGHVASDRGWSAWSMVALEGGLAVAVLALFRYGFPAAFDRAQVRMDDLFFRENILEVGSLYAPETGVIFGPLYQHGLAFYLALGVVGWATWTAWRRDVVAYLVPACFMAYFLVLAGIQVRFAGQLALFTALFGGIAIVYVLAAIEATRPLAPVPHRSADLDEAVGGSRDRVGSGPAIAIPRSLERLTFIVLFVGLLLGLNVIFAPGLIDQATYDDGFDAAMAIADHAEATDREYPATYVLSRWGDNRMYNFFVNGEAQGYGYAQANYERFLVEPDPDAAASDYGRMGYVVVASVGGDEGTTQRALFQELGAGDEPATRYRLIHHREGLRTFAVVEGATLRLEDGDEPVVARTEVDVDGTTLTYEIELTSDDDGSMSARVPYPGEYTVGEHIVVVPADAVEAGDTVDVA
ncbi:MAG: STT3 domain-containing protein [Haloferacaceae archaeon]